MTPGRIGRGSFLCAPGLGSGKQKQDGKSAPTPLSYHERSLGVNGKMALAPEICALHKSECLHLGNIPS